MTQEAIISNWIKQGDLKKKKDYGLRTLLIAEVEYINTNNNLNIKSLKCKAL